MPETKCAECGEPIGDSQYIYKYYPDEKLHKPAHMYHFSGKKGGKSA